MATDLDSGLAGKIERLCGYGLRAPSVHNIQPWALKLGHDTLEVFVDEKRRLSAGDPTGREVWLSLGCLIENCLMAAPSLGLEPVEVEFDSDETGRVARLRFRATEGPGDSGILDAINNRYSDRSVFSDQKLDRDKLEALARCWQEEGAEVVFSDDPVLIGLIADLTKRGVGLALSMPAFREELSELILPNHSSGRAGIPGYALRLGWLRSLIEPYVVRYGLNRRGQADKEYVLMKSAAAVALVLSEGDGPQYWLRSGRALERVAVSATSLGISLSVSAAVVEAADYHLDIEKELGTSKRLQTVLRLGYSQARPVVTPRYSLEEVRLT